MHQIPFKFAKLDEIKIDASELIKWMDEFDRLYTRITINGKNLSFWVNCHDEYKVTYGLETLYQGSQLTHAIAAFEFQQKIDPSLRE